jgi:hypothetical protein
MFQAAQQMTSIKQGLTRLLVAKPTLSRIGTFISHSMWMQAQLLLAKEQSKIMWSLASNRVLSHKTPFTPPSKCHCLRTIICLVFNLSMKRIPKHFLFCNRSWFRNRIHSCISQMGFEDESIEFGGWVDSIAPHKRHHIRLTLIHMNLVFS